MPSAEEARTRAREQRQPCVGFPAPSLLGGFPLCCFIFLCGWGLRPILGQWGLRRGREPGDHLSSPAFPWKDGASGSEREERPRSRENYGRAHAGTYMIIAAVLDVAA